MKIQKSLSILMLGLSAFSAFGQSAAKFEAVVPYEQVFEKNSKVWQAYGSQKGDVGTHADEYFVIAAKRADGFLVVMRKEPSFSDPKKMTYTGYFIQCGVMEDYPLFASNAKELKEAIENPILSPGSSLAISKDSRMFDTYRRVCHK